MLFRRIFGVLVLLLLVLALFGLFSKAHSASNCSPNTLSQVGSNRETIAVFSGEKAKELVRSLGDSSDHDWNNTHIKVVSGGHLGYVHLLVIENNCVVSIISRLTGIYQAAVSK